MAAQPGARCGLPSLSRTPWSWCCTFEEAARCVLCPLGHTGGGGPPCSGSPQPQARGAQIGPGHAAWAQPHVVGGSCDPRASVSPAVQNHPSAAHLWEMVFSDARTPEAGVLTLLSFPAGWPAAACHPPLWLQGECARARREAGCWTHVAAAAGPAVFVPECPIRRAAAAVVGGPELSSPRAPGPGQPRGPAAPGPSCPMS